MIKPKPLPPLPNRNDPPRAPTGSPSHEAKAPAPLSPVPVPKPYTPFYVKRALDPELLRAAVELTGSVDLKPVLRLLEVADRKQLSVKQLLDTLKRYDHG